VSDIEPGTGSPGEAITYATALRELEEILLGLERDNVDVDHLAERVKRASELIRLCRERISTAQLQIEQVVTDLDASS
jgi:exodeoxyribonuclease VII small subunit